MYDGSTAAAEAVMMAVRLNRPALGRGGAQPAPWSIERSWRPTPRIKGMPLSVADFTDDGRLNLQKLEKSITAGDGVCNRPVAELFFRHD